ncbi:MAG: hypothetical protein CMF38_02980 [Legionellaceae bacterium]|nr:hypothetical protein [Legionellaceae bacterium]|tara:strand:- start:245 stop:1012 length:768 start_codon:yes stop_codon:yes gene_type:complete
MAQLAQKAFNVQFATLQIHHFTNPNVQNAFIDFCKEVETFQQNLSKYSEKDVQRATRLLTIMTEAIPIYHQNSNIEYEKTGDFKDWDDAANEKELHDFQEKLNEVRALARTWPEALCAAALKCLTVMATILAFMTVTAVAISLAMLPVAGLAGAILGLAIIAGFAAGLILTEKLGRATYQAIDPYCDRLFKSDSTQLIKDAEQFMMFGQKHWKQRSQAPQELPARRPGTIIDRGVLSNFKRDMDRISRATVRPVN